MVFDIIQLKTGQSDKQALSLWKFFEFSGIFIHSKVLHSLPGEWNLFFRDGHPWPQPAKDHPWAGATQKEIPFTREREKKFIVHLKRIFFCMQVSLGRTTGFFEDCSEIKGSKVFRPGDDGPFVKAPQIIKTKKCSVCI